MSHKIQHGDAVQIQNHLIPLPKKKKHLLIKSLKSGHTQLQYSSSNHYKHDHKFNFYNKKKLFIHG